MLNKIPDSRPTPTETVAWERISSFSNDNRLKDIYPRLFKRKDRFKRIGLRNMQLFQVVVNLFFGLELLLCVIVHTYTLLIRLVLLKSRS